MKNRLTKGDIVLLLLYANNCSPIVGRTRFQKILFVFEKEIFKQYGFNKKIELTSPSLFDFSAYNYGPFSAEAYKLLEFFINIGMVSKRSEDTLESIAEGINDYEIINSDFEQSGGIEDVVLPPRYVDEEYSLEPKGKSYVEDKLLHLYEEKKEILDNFKEKFVNSSLKKILRHVYTKYPDMTTNSKIKNEVLK